MPDYHITFTQAVARQEGFYKAGTRAARNCNPGNLEYGAFTLRHGAIGTDGRFAIFPDPQVGFACMKALFLGSYMGLTVRQAIAKYAPAGENDVDDYVANVCVWVGCSSSDIIDAYILAS